MREKQSRRRYNLEFKKAAIAKAKQSDNVSQTARDLGLNIALLHSWVSQDLKARNKGLTLENVREEKKLLQRLKRETSRGEFNPKKSDGVFFSKSFELKYAWISSHLFEFSLSAMARVLKVSRSGYHAWKLRPTEPEKDALIKVEVAAMFDKSKKTYGSRRMTTALNNKSIPISEKKIRRIMKESNLHAKADKRFRVTTLSDNNLPVAKNILNREFNAMVQI